MRKRSWMVLLGLGVALNAPAAGLVHAQSAPAKGSAAVANPTKDAVKKLYDDGRKAADAGKWEQALEAFGAAFKLKPIAQIAGNLGHAELQLGRYRDAVEHFTFFLTDPTVGAAERKQVEEWLAKAKAKIATLQIEVSPDLAGADVLVDGSSAGKAPILRPVFVDPGPHTVEARQGDLFDKQSIDVPAGTAKDVTLAPRKATAAPTKSPPPPEASPARTGVLASLAVLSAAGLGVGIGGVAVAESKGGEIARQCAPGACLLDEGQWRGLAQDRATLGNLGIGGFVVAGAAAVGAGLVLLAWRPAAGRQGTTTGRIGVVPAGTGVAVTGVW